MVYRLVLYLSTCGLLGYTEAMVGSAFSLVKREGDSVPLCATDQPSAVITTNSAIWCGIECIVSTSPSTCQAFSYSKMINKCNIFYFAPTTYAVADDCITYGVIGMVAEFQTESSSTVASTNPPTSTTAQPVNEQSSTTSAIVDTATDFLTTSATADSATSAILTAEPSMSASVVSSAYNTDSISAQQTASTNAISSAESVASTTNIAGSIVSTQQTPTAAAAAANTISTSGSPVAASASPIANTPDIISTAQAPLSVPSTIGLNAVSPAAATTTTASGIAKTGSSGQQFQTTVTAKAVTTMGATTIGATTIGATTMVATTTGITTGTTPPLTVAPPPNAPARTYNCDSKIAPASRLMMQENTGNGLDQTWSAYKYGFNDGQGGYWMGNEILYKMTNNHTTCRLCIDMQDSTSSWYYAYYTSFVVGSESVGYNFTSGGFTGNVANTFGLSNSICKFNAKDQNNQPACPNFASSLKGGWWYPCSATQIVLNGVGSTGFFWTNPPMPNPLFLKASYMWIACP